MLRRSDEVRVDVAVLELLLGQLGLFLLLAATAWAAGRILVAGLQPDAIAHPLAWVVGFAVLGQAAWLLALCGLLRPIPLLATIAGIHLLAWRDWATLLARVRNRLSASPRHAAGLVAVAALAIAPGFLVGVLPPTSFDETAYHLPFVQAMASTHALAWVPELRFPTFPLLSEALAAALYLAGGELATHLPALLATFATAALLVSWGREADHEPVGWLAAGVFLGSPLITYLAGTSLVEPALTLLMTAAFYASWRAARETGPGWPLLAGFLAGSSAAVKYIGLYAVVATVGYLAAQRPRSPRRAALAALAAVATVAPTCARQWVLTGNPVHPFLTGLFGHSAWDLVEMPRGMLAILRLPYDAALHHHAVGWSPPLSPVYFLSAPILVALAIASRRARPALVVLLGYVLLLATHVADARFLDPVLPLWSLLLGAGVAWASATRLRSPLGRRSTILLATALALPGVLYGPYFVARAGGIPADPRARETYLESDVPGYPSLLGFERKVGTDEVLYFISGERLRGLARVRMLGEWTGPWRFQPVIEDLDDPAALSSRLRAMGVAHLMLARADAERLLALHGAGERFTKVYEDEASVALAIR